MAALTYDVTYTEARNRLTVAFRLILAIPHLIVAQVWGYLAQILGIIEWFVILFTGKRNRGMWDLQRAWLGYYGRAIGYVSLLHDEFPPFGTDAGNVPVRESLDFEENANRLTSGLRLIWLIPAAIISAVLGIAAQVLAVISWFAILITGKQPKGMWDFIHKAVSYLLQTQSYALLMTDTYPKYG